MFTADSPQDLTCCPSSPPVDFWPHLWTADSSMNFWPHCELLTPLWTSDPSPYELLTPPVDFWPHLWTVDHPMNFWPRPLQTSDPTCELLMPSPTPMNLWSHWWTSGPTCKSLTPAVQMYMGQKSVSKPAVPIVLVHIVIRFHYLVCKPMTHGCIKALLLLWC